MDDEIDDLYAALRVSPDNVPVKLMLAGALLKRQRYDEAENQCKEVLAIDGENLKAKTIYARAALTAGKENVFEVIAEDLEAEGQASADIADALAVLRGKRGVSVAAGGSIDPDDSSESDDSRESGDDRNEDGDYLIEKPDIKFSDVGGMAEVKDQIRKKIILPIEKPELFAALGKKAGGGILLYGPPGCGKTYIAKATAGEIASDFIVVSLENVLDMWMGGTEKKLHAVFEAARRRRPCVLFIDEIDALGAKRSTRSGTSARTDINQFLSELDGIASSNEGILVLGATNMPWAIDSAFRRPGRFDRVVFVPPPDELAREEILRIHCKGKPAADIDFRKIAQKAKGFSGADLRGLVDLCVENKIEESIARGGVSPIGTDDLLRALKQARASTGEWLATARSHALYSNTDGLYDPIAEYLGLK